MSDTATQHMVGLLRSLADELEAGNGVALKTSIDTPHGSGLGNMAMRYTRTYELSLAIAQPKPKMPEVR